MTAVAPDYIEDPAQHEWHAGMFRHAWPAESPAYSRTCSCDCINPAQLQPITKPIDRANGPRPVAKVFHKTHPEVPGASENTHSCPIGMNAITCLISSNQELDALQHH